MQGERKIIWLFGGSGSGKSSVAYSTAERLRSKDHLAATFFFSRKHLSRSQTDHVFPTIAYRIGLLHAHAKEVIIKAIKDDPELLTAEKSRREQFEKLVTDPLRALQYVWCTKRAMIFDAADEGEGDQINDLVYMLIELLRDPSIPISSILFTSRPLFRLGSLTRNNGIESMFISLRIEDFEATHDIEVFLCDSLRRIYEDRELQFMHPQPWPPPNLIASLLNRIRGQFIVAATICRLIRDATDPIECLDLVSDMYTGEVEPLSLNLTGIDSVYYHILSDCDTTSRIPGAKCLADITALAETLSLSDLCRLFATRDVPKHITHLSAIVVIPSIESRDTVQVYHASLRDYLSDESRSQEFYVHPKVSHQRLVCMCLRLMKRDLRKDICGLEDPSKLHSEFEDFIYRREAYISGALRYACLYWPYHLLRSECTEETRALVVYFVKKQLLFFVEASAIIGSLHAAVNGLTDVQRAISKWKPSDDQKLALKLLYDAVRLVLQFIEPISNSALQLYASALPMCPVITQLSSTYRDLFKDSEVSVEYGLNNPWNYIIRTFAVEDGASIVMSPDGRRYATVVSTAMAMSASGIPARTPSTIYSRPKAM
ncbi:hypothetical protein CONPUDRAFT_166870 [Coniophora puteana RWD-64-598 SS2]|uniref:NACHT domain-containing protein n=1 Tax=Coniophora puteana (strain RWD-64-598) TaxID=741705 RepID=A0A5M3MJQ3_CONPW|nr:uncharacterized protein CONPUDRAFT_166870 [Coniophora puteana RWD-64-598 SS2]EIW79034.1 hypothetical protein CONPUDRAFT_166870 [Coniophora puteana RWD-64-598 SS2]